MAFVADVKAGSRTHQGFLLRRWDVGCIIVHTLLFKWMLNDKRGFEDGEGGSHWGTSEWLRLAGCRAEVEGQRAVRPHLPELMRAEPALRRCCHQNRDVTWRGGSGPEREERVSRKESPLF